MTPLPVPSWLYRVGTLPARQANMGLIHPKADDAFGGCPHGAP